MYMYVYTYVYIYIYIEREIYTMCVYITIYIERERDIATVRKPWTIIRRNHLSNTTCLTHGFFKRDK